jgi:PPM family protein phosphatase
MKSARCWRSSGTSKKKGRLFGMGNSPGDGGLSRPPVFEAGTPIGQHLRVESCVRVSGDRVHYFVNNRDPRWTGTKCWVCGNKNSPALAQACTFCHSPLGFRRMLMTSRFQPEHFEAYKAYLNRRVVYDTLEPPVAVYRYHNQMLAFFPWGEDALLAHESSPLPSRKVLSMAFDLTVALSHLHDHGVVLRRLSPLNLLFSRVGCARLYDLEIEALLQHPVPPAEDPTCPPLRDLRQLAAILDDYVPVEDEPLRQFFRNARRGRFHTADDFAGGIAEFARGRSTAPTSVRASGRTDAGVVRGLNEDAWGWQTPADGVRVYVVADGMGGHLQGDAASRLAVRTFLRTTEKGFRTQGPVKDTLIAGFVAANTAIRETCATGAGTTLVAMVSDGDKMQIANCGDSRAYLLRDGHLSPITEDHSMVAAMVAAGKIKPEEAWTHPKANVLLHYIGATGSVDPDVYTTQTRPGDRFLLCSDGLWGEVPDSKMRAILMAEDDPRRAVQRLVESATMAGGRDNITAIVVDT